MPENTCWINNDGTRSLLQKIQAAGVSLRDVDGGRPFTSLMTAITELIPTNYLEAVEPPTYGYGSVGAFINMAIQFLPPSERWILAILTSELIDWVWRQTRGEGSGFNTISPVEHLGMMPIAIPHPDIQERLWEMVERVVAEADDVPLLLEIRADLDERVYSIYGFNCGEIDLVEFQEP